MIKNRQQIKENNWSENNDVNNYCCTCGKLQYNEKKKQVLLKCCSRLVCQNCINEFPQRALFCHFCQIPYKLSPTNSLPDQPCQAYSVSLSPLPAYEAPPTYESLMSVSVPQNLYAGEKNDARKLSAETDNVIHFLDHKYDTVVSLSFRYGVPLPILRQMNNLTSDHLLSARRTVMIPRKYCKSGLSLSPQPVEGEERDREKIAIRRFMVTCKISEYDVALLYLKQLDFNLESAIEAYREDEKWEQDHPLKHKEMNTDSYRVGKRLLKSHFGF